MPSARMVFDVLVNDRASGSFKAMGREAEAAGGKVTSLEARLNKLGKAAFGLTAIFAAFAVNAAAKFESSMTRISTQAGVPIGQIKALGDAILNLAPKVGTGPDALAVSLYHVESAFRTTGISAGKAIDIVTQAAKLAKIGNADLESTTQAIIGTLASGIKGVKDATDAAAQLNQLVGAGDTTLSAVTKSIGTGILPTAAALGLSFKDIAAAIATLTDNATPADEAATRLRTTLSLVEKPSKQAYAALSSIGLSSTSLAEDFRKPNGLLLAMEDLKTHLDATYPPSRSAKLSISEIQAATTSYVTSLEQQGVTQKAAIDLGKKYEKSLQDGGSAATLQAQTILQAFGGAKSGSTFLTLYEELTRLQSKYKDFGTSAQAAAKFQEAWANQQKTFKQKLDDLKASWDVFLIKAGNAILPTLKKIVDFLSAHPKLLHDAAVGIGLFAAAWVAVKIGSLISNMGTLAARILGVGTAARTAAAEVATANLGGAGAASGAFAAGGAARAGSSSLFAGLAKSTLTKIAIPIGLTLVAADLLKSLDQAARDIQKGHYTDGIAKVLSSKLAEGLTFGLSKGLADALKSGDWAKVLTGTPGYKALQGLLDHFGVGGSGPLSGTAGGGLGQSADQKLQQTLQGQLDKVNSQLFTLFTSGKTGTALYQSLQEQQYLITNALAALSEQTSQAAVNKYLTALAKQKKAFDALFPDAKKPKPLSSLFPGVPGANAPGRSATGDAPNEAVRKYLTSLEGSKALFSKLFPQQAVNNLVKVQTYLKSLADESNNYSGALKTLNSHLDANAGLIGDASTATVNNRNILKSEVQTVEDHAQAVYRQTGNLGLAKQAFSDGIATIEDNATALGLNRDTTSDLVNKLLGVKNNANLKINVDANGTFTLQDIAFSGDTQSLVSGHHATGGLIRGRGTGTSDSIPTWLSNGEYVIPAHRVKQFGIGFFENIRQGFADGGLASFNANFVPNINKGLDGLETAMNVKAQQWFSQRKTEDLKQLGNIGGSGVARWAPLVLQVLAMLGQPASFLPNVLRQIATESGGNPGITQGISDSNSAQGILAQGLLQVIPGTFAANAGPYIGLGPFNPLASLYAGLHHAIYDDPGGLNYLGQGHGYANGTSSALRGWAKVGERGPEWVNFGGGEQVLKHGQTPGVGTVLNIEHYHAADAVSEDGLAQRIALKTRAVMASRRL